MNGFTLPQDWYLPIAVGAMVLVLVVIGSWIKSVRRARAETIHGFETTIEALRATVDGLKGALDAQTATSAARDGELLRTIGDQIGRLQQGTGNALDASSQRTAQMLASLGERLATIDSAQANIATLSRDVVGLREILSNKQTRGAFGELQLSEILRNALAPNAYAEQVTLSNNKRVDAAVQAGKDLPIPIDAKFPLEPYEAILAAQNADTRNRARTQFRQAITGHAKAIAEKYILPGETADSALMFLPSEAIYAELHAEFPDVVRQAMALNVWIVSPTTLMAVLVTLRGIARDDALMKEAHKIRRELGLLGDDVRRLVERTAKVAAAHTKMGEDLHGVQISAEKVGKRADRLATLDFGESQIAAE